MISLNWTLVLQIVNFLVLLIILNKLLFQPILKVMDEREAETEGKEQAARDMEQESDEIEKTYREKLRQAKIEASGKKNEIKALGQEEEGKILSAARQEGDSAISKVRGEIAAEAEAAKEDLLNQAKGMSELIFEKLLGRVPS